MAHARCFARVFLSVCLRSWPAAACAACADDTPRCPVYAAGAGYRFERGGWTYVHLEGTPAEIGYQHGRLLAPEIADLVRVTKLETQHSTHRDWNFYREAGRKMFWPHIEAEYQQELEGIAKGVQSQGFKLDVWDIVALNGSIELPEYYVPWLNKHEHAANAPQILPRRPLLGLHCHGQLHEGRKDRDRAQQLVELRGWRALDGHVRYPARARASHCDGWRTGRDHQPG